MSKQTIQYSYSLVHENIITLCILLHILTSVFTEHLNTAPKCNHVVYKIKYCINISGCASTQRQTHKQKYKLCFKYYIGGIFPDVCELITVFAILLFTLKSVNFGLQLLNIIEEKVRLQKFWMSYLIMLKAANTELIRGFLLEITLAPIFYVVGSFYCIVSHVKTLKKVNPWCIIA